jgi:hypothetical protein
MATILSLAIDVLILDADIQPRETMSSGLVHEYAVLYRDGHAFPPIKVFHDGNVYWVADGFHRVSAAREAGLSAIHVDVEVGTKREAILYSSGANKHGKPRSPADKRRAVWHLLEDAEWRQWSDHAMARHCGVDHKTVARWRKEVTRELPSERTYRTKHGTPTTMNTTNIGKRTLPGPQEAPTTMAVHDVAVRGVDPAESGSATLEDQEGQPVAAWNPVAIEEAMQDEVSADDISRAAIETRFPSSAVSPEPTTSSPALVPPLRPTPQEQAADDPSVKWHRMLHDVYVQLNSIRDHGGIGQLAERWSLETKRDHVEKLGRIQVLFHGIQEELMGLIALEDVGSQSDQRSGHLRAERSETNTHEPRGNGRESVQKELGAHCTPEGAEPKRAEDATYTDTEVTDKDGSMPKDMSGSGAQLRDHRQEVIARVKVLRAEKRSLREIAATLNAEGVATFTGQGRWHHGNLPRLLRADEAKG